MDWRTRIAAIVLAGGSVAGCASAADPGDAGAPEAGPPRTSIDPPEVGIAPLPTVATVPVSVTSVRPPPPPPGPRVRIPACNANPDPCCRSPDAPECHLPE